MKLTMDDGTVYDLVPEGTVERLRAAVPSLPDVGPVTRGGTDRIVLRAGGYSFDGTQTAEYHRMRAAQFLAVAAFLDAEAVDDDEVEEVAGFLFAADNGDTPWADAWNPDAYRRMARAVIAHRACNGQEAGL